MGEENLGIIVNEGGAVSSVRLFGFELLDAQNPCQSELWVNGRPLQMRVHRDPNDPTRNVQHLKGEQFIDQLTGWALVLARVVGSRSNLAHPCVGIQTIVRREPCDLTGFPHGPGGPVIEAPLHVDTLSILNWNWKFWGDETRMVFTSTHANGPADEGGHIGHEHDTPEQVKKFLQNVWRRIYPGCLLLHGGAFYNARTGHWIAITCRQPHVGYILNIENAGRGIGYDYTLHAPFKPGESLQLPEIKLYYGADNDSMMRWMADYATHYYEEPPAWAFKTVWGEGLHWNNKPTWAEQGEYWNSRLETGEFSGIGYSLVTNRPIHSGTTPTGYEPDPNYGTIEEFKKMCRRFADRGVPLLIWMSHSGMLYRGGQEIDDDWFIYGIDGKTSASWGTIDQGGLTHINPGHPGYIEYTKKWIRFYIRECGAKGIFFDCLSWAFPCDFRPRSFMRYPGDTNLMAIRFQREVYACIKECDPDAIMLGEGASMDAPVNIIAIAGNPVRAGSVDGMGPRDFLLSINGYSRKRITLDQGPRLFAGSGFCHLAEGETWHGHNKLMTSLLRQKGSRNFVTALPGDLSLLNDRAGGDIIIVPPVGDSGAAATRDLSALAALSSATALTEVLTGRCIERKSADGAGFKLIEPGIYRAS